MTPGRSSKPAGWFSGRTRLITIVSIVAVGVAGAAAVSANIGILDSASDSAVGNASVTGVVDAGPGPVVDAQVPETAPSSATVQEFAVDVAGTVAVADTDTGLRVDQVAPAAGWRGTVSQSDPTALTVTMTNGTRTIEFRATKAADGTITARVDEPIVTPAPAGDLGDDDHHEDDDDHYEDDEDEEYEGGEDDD